MNLSTKDLLWLGVLVLGFVHAFIVYEQLPDVIAVHWGFDGQADVFMSRAQGAYSALLIGLLVAVALRLTLIHPSVAEVREYMHGIVLMLACVITGVNVMILEVALGADIAPARAAWLIAGVVLVATCNPLGKLPINPVAGVRIPETTDDPEVWLQVNRFAGWLGTVLGLTMVIAYFAPIDLHAVALVGLVVLFPIAIVIYARRLSRQRSA